MADGIGPEHPPEQVELPPLPDVEAASAEASQWTDAPMENAPAEAAPKPPAEPAPEPAPPSEVWNDPPEEIPERVSGAEAADIQAKAGDVDAQIVDQAGRPDGLQQAVEDKLDQPLTDGAAADLHVPESSELVREVRTGSQEEFDADMTRNRERVEGAVHQATDQAQEQMARETEDRQLQEAFNEASKADAAAFEQKQADEQAFFEKKAADEASFEEKKAADQKFFDDKKADEEAFEAKQAADQAAVDRRREEEDDFAEKSAQEKAALEERAEQERAQEEELEAKRRAALESARRNRPRPPGGPGF